MSDPAKIEEDFDSIYQDFNGSTFGSNEELYAYTNLSQSQIVTVQKKYLYDQGLATSAKMMMLYPIGAVDRVSHILTFFGLDFLIST